MCSPILGQTLLYLIEIKQILTEPNRNFLFQINLFAMRDIQTGCWVYWAVGYNMGWGTYVSGCGTYVSAVKYKQFVLNAVICVTSIMPKSHCEA